LITTLFVNVPVVVFAWIELNAVMDIFYSVPATTISVIVSSAAFIELIELKICDISEADTSQDPQHIRSSGKGVEVLTSHVDISPSLFINSDELPEGITRNSFDEESGMRTAREGVIGVGEGASIPSLTILHHRSDGLDALPRPIRELNSTDNITETDSGRSNTNTSPKVALEGLSFWH